jgi:hypothetical protein
MSEATELTKKIIRMNHNQIFQKEFQFGEEHKTQLMLELNRAMIIFLAKQEQLLLDVLKREEDIHTNNCKEHVNK